MRWNNFETYSIHTMDLDALISFFGWAALTDSWLHVNLTFFGAIGQAIENHNDAIRQEALQELQDENEDEDEDENEN